MKKLEELLCNAIKDFGGKVYSSELLRYHAEEIIDSFKARLPEKRKCEQCEIPYSDCGCYVWNRAITAVSDAFNRGE